MKPKVSILVPVYNVSDYIEKCARSLFEQTFSDVEYIFVNDHSTDDSMEKLSKVIEQYPQRKKQITIIQHKKNLGIAATRNIALKTSKGDYISFVDSDDFVNLDMIEQLYEIATAEDADIIVSDLYLKKINETTLIKDYVFDNLEERLKEIILCNISHPALWNKLIRRTLFQHIDYQIPEKLYFYEDRLVMLKLYFYAKKIVKIDKAFYYYVQYNSNAITKNRDRMHFESVRLYWNLVESFLREVNQYEINKETIDLQKVRSKSKLMIGTSSNELRKEYSKLFHEEEFRNLSNFHRGEKLMLLLVRYGLFGLAKLFHQYLIFKHKKNGK